MRQGINLGNERIGDYFVLYDELTGRVYTGYENIKKFRIKEVPVLKINSSYDLFNAKIFITLQLAESHLETVADLVQSEDAEFFGRLEIKRLQKTARIQPL